MPGQSIPPHNHEESDLLLHVLSGKFDLTVDDKTTGLNAGDVVHCTGREVFSMNNVKENTTCLVVLVPSPEMKAYSQEIGVQEIGFQTGDRYKNIQQ
jgi:quercetin dioxygenase-like cupin family protein